MWEIPPIRLGRRDGLTGGPGPPPAADPGWPACCSLLAGTLPVPGLGTEGFPITLHPQRAGHCDSEGRIHLNNTNQQESIISVRLSNGDRDLAATGSVQIPALAEGVYLFPYGG